MIEEEERNGCTHRRDRIVQQVKNLGVCILDIYMQINRGLTMIRGKDPKILNITAVT
jgi:hypothetical protein